CSDMSCILLAAFICKIPIRIVHSHNSFSLYWNKKTFSNKAKLAYFLNKLSIRLFATNKLGCSKEACKTMYGDKAFKDKRTKVIFNGIDLDKFNSKNFIMYEVKKKYNINNEKINFINVARFDESKNQIFLVDVFNKLYSIRKDINLIFIGYGELENQIKKRVIELNLEKSISFLPHNSNIPEILSAMDYFLLPSIYEGLGIVLIEAQAMGLPCFVSDCVPRESQIGLCSYIPLEIGVIGWAKYINKYINDNIKRTVDIDKLSKYDIKNTVKELEKIYNNNELF
ncbi:glycosyltransferase, partial [Clostridium tarantellae]